MAGPRRRCIRGAFRILSSSDVKRRRRRAFFCTKVLFRWGDEEEEGAGQRAFGFRLHRVLLFLGVYCGCSEDGSRHAGCSMNFTSGKRQKGIKTVLMHSMPEAADLGDVFHLEDPQLVLTPGNSVLPVTESHRDIYMEPEEDFQMPVEIIGKETASFPSKLVESYDLSQKSGITAESECPSPMETEPSRSVGFLENSVAAALLQCNGGVCEESKGFHV